jgi:cardiolipin synthase
VRSDLIIALHLLVQVALIVRILLRPHRDPASRVAWIAVVLAVPLLGIAAYLFLGETSIGRGRARRLKRVIGALPDPACIPGYAASVADCTGEEMHPAFRVGRSISGYAPVAGNRARLMADSDAAIDEMTRDIDAAARHVHLLFYIWLPDRNGARMADALIRAVARGVACRAMVDDLGSRALVRSALWREMGARGVRLARALPVGNPLLSPFNGRIDLRNHRKILVVDNRITYCGSQNCADPEFLPKARYGPWVDAVMRFEGPVARQNQHLFAGDWTMWTGEDLGDVLLESLAEPTPGAGPGFPAQVVATGPTARFSAAPEMFETLIYGARRRLFVTTPYYVPVESLQAALCAAGNRGVETTIVFPARNDDFAVAAASRSYYADLLEAGVAIHEYRAGLLHTKSLTVDDELTFIGSANMDRRSFELNYENNVLLLDRATTAAMLARQRSYLADCDPIRLEDVAAWGWHRRLWNNAMAVLGPVL